MKSLDKKMMLLLLAMLLSYGNNALSYTFHITNLTGQDVKVGLYYFALFFDGKLNKKDKLIKAYDMRKFSWKFGSLEAGLCLSKIEVSTKKSGKWVKKKKAKIQFVSEERFEEIAKTPFFGSVYKEALKWWGKTGCGNRDFILIVDPESKEIRALTS